MAVGGLRVYDRPDVTVAMKQRIEYARSHSFTSSGPATDKMVTRQ